MRQRATDERGGRREEDDERGADRGHQGIEAGERGLRREAEDGVDDERQTQRRARFARGAAELDLALGGEVVRDEGAHQQLPRAGRQQVERGVRLRVCGPLRHDQAGDGNARAQHPQRTPPEARHEHQEQREEEIELLFDAETPRVQQRLELRGGIEIAGGEPEQHVRCEARDGREALREPLHVGGQQPGPRQRQADREHDEERRQDAPRAAFVEVDDAERAGALLVDDDGGDQVAADHEEHVHADVATAEEREARVVEDDGQHGDRSQPVHFAPMVHTRSLSGGLLHSVGACCPCAADHGKCSVKVRREPGARPIRPSTGRVTSRITGAG